MRFQGKDDYKINLGLGVAETGTGSGTSGWLDLGEYADEVDIIMDLMTLATNNTVGIAAYQNSVATDSGSSTLSLDAALETMSAAGQVKQRLQAGDDPGQWDGPVEGRYLSFVGTIGGTNTTAVTVMIGATLTIRSREYPVE